MKLFTIHHLLTGYCELINYNMQYVASGLINIKKDENIPKYNPNDMFETPISIATYLSRQFTKRPPSIPILQMEIENYEKLYKQAEIENKSKQIINSLWMEIVTRKDQYRNGTGLTHYESSIDVIKSEKYHLMKLFITLSGYSWSNNFGWSGINKTSMTPEINAFDPSASLCDGIIVSEDNDNEDNDLNYKRHIVKQINFNGKGCRGILKHNIGEMQKLEQIQLDHNMISGPIPSNFNNLKHLTILSFQSNLMKGVLDITIFENYTNLTILNLSFNKFTGPIQDIFDQLLQLKEINLSGNSFSGYLPKSISLLTKLEILKLYSNQLIGEIPIEYSLLTNLTDINISNNQLTNNVYVLFKNKNLLYLNTKNNLFSDVLDESLSNLSSLVYLQLSNNRLQGSFQSTWCNGLKSIKYMNLSNNYLTGILPNEIGLLTQLQSLILSNNNLIGPLPTELSNLINLKDFHLLSNYPSESMYIPRGFNQYTFDRIYKFGPSLGIDNITWIPSKDSNTNGNNNNILIN